MNSYRNRILATNNTDPNMINPWGMVIVQKSLVPKVLDETHYHDEYHNSYHNKCHHSHDEENCFDIKPRPSSPEPKNPIIRSTVDVFQHGCEEEFVSQSCPHSPFIPKNAKTCNSPEIWVTDNGTDKVTSYNFCGDVTNVLTVPGKHSGDLILPAKPTGIVHNTTAGFLFGTPSLPGLLIIATETGELLAWNPSVNPTLFVLVFTATDGAVYKGLEINGNFLFATDFHNGKIDVFNNTFALVSGYPFVDPSPLPAGFKPFNIITGEKGTLIVTNALNNGDDDDTKGPGYGIVNIFNLDGSFNRRLVNNDEEFDLNSPWGISGDIDHVIIGNFGNGHINKFNRITGRHSEEFKDENGYPIVIDGLWTIYKYCGIYFYVAGDFTEDVGILGFLEKC
jgi:uncharacterized protein (TIGR03118 family)